MRKLFSLFLALVATTSLWAEDFSVGGIYYNYLDGNNVEVTYRGDNYMYAEYSGEVIIPSTVTYNGTTYSVTNIGDEAFRGCSSLTSITIPESVTNIGNSAFYGCSSLTSVTIPNSVTSIGKWAFQSCSSLTSVTINSDAIVNKTYSYSSNISDIFGSQVIEYIIGDDVKGIGYAAFDGCFSLTSITIGNSVTSIGDGAFVSCFSLTSVTIPNSVTCIGNNAFSGCSGLTSITIPESVTSIGGSALSNCSSLTSVTIPNSITSIGDGAFYACTSLTSITIPNSVTSIGDEAFAYCKALTSITIGNSVTSIRDGAFRYCESLNTLTCLAMTPPALLGEHVFYGCYYPTLFVPCAALSDYQAHEQWGQFTTIECISSEETDTEDVIIESGTTTIQKIMRDGQLIILRDGVKYNAMGAQIQ